MTAAGRAALPLPGGGSAGYWPLAAAGRQEDLARVPYTIRILLEGALRARGAGLAGDAEVAALAGWRPGGDRPTVPFAPTRVLLQDFTGVPAVVDLAAMRDQIVEWGGDPSLVNPQVPVDLVVDHSVQVDVSGRDPDAREKNLEIEYGRNRERYEFLKWGQRHLSNFRVVPPGRGIVHQVNLEWLAPVVASLTDDAGTVLAPDTLVGTDSHTTMVNGLGVLGWGVGGIEAEAAMLGQPLPMPVPEVVGFRLVGRRRPGVTATDLVLRVTEMLRERGVVGRFVEFVGEGLDALSLPDRATLANMAPEYGATCGFFPVDEVTLGYLRLTGRDAGHVETVAAYLDAQGLFRRADSPEPDYSDSLILDLDAVEPSLAGPKRPQDRVALTDMKEHWNRSLTAPTGHSGHGVDPARAGAKSTVRRNGDAHEIGHGAVAIAAITSCTNTSNPGVMLAAGLLARNAVAAGLEARPWVKTSLAPGSRVVTDYYSRAGLLEPLADLGFAVVGYGCTTCIGNSGPLDGPVAEAVAAGDLVVAGVLSGNRNFEGRIHGAVRANYLASPPLVVAYALAGTVDIDFDTEPIGEGADGPVFLRDLWPAEQEVREAMAAAVGPDLFAARYADITEEPRWDAIAAADESLYPWDEASTYVRRPSFLAGVPERAEPLRPLRGARALLVLGDSVTTDHISPAGAIPPTGPAGKWLRSEGVGLLDFNSFGSRRGNHEVMVRGTFANLRLRNLLAPGTEGGMTRHQPSGEETTVWEAACRYRDEGVSLVVLAGDQYGTGSSRDWAAKGTLLLGVRAVIAVGYERIHRSNLVGMGVLPLLFRSGESPGALGLDGTEEFAIPGLADAAPGGTLEVVAAGSGETRFTVDVALATADEETTWRQGGILPRVLRQLAGR